MKRVLIALLLLVCVPVFAGVVYQEDFESYEVGTQMAEQEGWEFYNNYSGNTTVVDNAPNIDSKAMELSQSMSGSTEYVMVLTPTFDAKPESIFKEVTKVSTKVVSSSSTDLFALYDKNMNRFFYLHLNAVDGLMASNPGGVSFDNFNSDGLTPNEISFVFDHLNNQITSVTCNGETQECAIMLETTCEQPWRLRLSTYLGSLVEGAAGTYYDYVTVENVNRAEEPTIFCDSDAVIPLDSTSAEFTLFNGGPEGEINFSVTTDAAWLEVTPDSGTFTDSTALTLKAKEDMPDGFYRGSMTVSGGAGEPKVVSVMCSKGNVIFEEKFDDMEDGSIVGQRGWTLDMGDVIVTNAYDCSGKCMFILGAGGNNACSMYLPEACWYENLVVKVSYDVYWPVDGTATDVCMLQKNSHEKFENYVSRDDSGEGFKLVNIQKQSGAKSIKNFPLASYDKWVTVEYTIDLQANMLLSFGWDGAITNFNNFQLKKPEVNFYNSWGYAVWDNANGVLECNHGIDNLKVERVEREADPTLIVPMSASVGVNESAAITVLNGGKGTFDYTAEVLDLPENVTLDPSSGTVEETQEVTLTVDREGLEDNYYRTRVVFNAGEAGCATTIVSFVVGGVYYSADFEEPFFTLGDFAGQDDWGDNNPGANVAYILSTNDNQTVMIEIGGGYGGYYHSLAVPENNIVRFDCDVFLPPAIFEREDLIGREVIYFKQNSMGSSAADITLDIDFMDGVPIVYGLDHANDYMFSTTEYAEDWMHVSYVIDYKEGKLVEFTIDDNSEYPVDAYINDSYKGAGCNLFCLCVTYQGNIQFDNVKVSVVPEPAVLGFLALLALALIRRK
ncbi:hypothetical protein J6X96_01695 [bacterium]|nr:hypothetical protein [bacterium]